MSERETRPTLVLVVDDEPMIRAVVRFTLEDEGYAVVECEGAAQVARIVAEAGGIDLLIVDIHVPGASGTEIAAMLRAAQPRLPVIVTSGSVDDLERAETLGIVPPPVHWLPKPFGPTAILAAVRAVEDDGR